MYLCMNSSHLFFLGMVKNEEIVRILQRFQLLFLVLVLLNAENVFIFGYFKGKIFKMFRFSLLHFFFSFSYLPLKKKKIQEWEGRM